MTMGVRTPIDIAIMFAAIWLLGSMIIDLVTPNELSVYMIAAALAPAVSGTALAYYLRLPKIDFISISTVLWSIAAFTIGWLSPVPLPIHLVVEAFAPAFIVGAILTWHRYRSGPRVG
jgi:hypothetical protein